MPDDEKGQSQDGQSLAPVAETDADTELDAGFDKSESAEKAPALAPEKKEEAPAKEPAKKSEEDAAKETDAGKDKGKEPEKKEEPAKQEEALQKRAKDATEREKLEKDQQSFLDTVALVHKDVREIVASEEFLNWMEKQPDKMRQMASEGTVSDAIQVLDLFKKSKEQSKKEVQAPPVAKAPETGEDAILSELLGLKFKSGDEEQTIAKLREDYGPVVDGFLAALRHLSAKQPKPQEAPAKTEPTEQEKAAFAAMERKMQAMDAEMRVLSFWNTVQAAHPDAKKISVSKEFKEWKDTQTESVKKMCTNGNPEDAIAIIDSFKHSVAQKSVEAQKEKAAGKKKVTDDLHSATLRGAMAEREQGKTVGTDDFDAGFKESDKAKG